MVGVLARLETRQRQELLDDLNYLNLQEIRLLCDRYSIPYRIVVETPAAGTKPTQDTDRPARIVRPAGPPALLKPTDRLYYRWYNKTYEQVIALLKELTDGRFRNGAMARVLIMEFWTSGRAPTFREYAFLSDLQRGQAGPDWKRRREQRAQRALATIDNLIR